MLKPCVYILIGVSGSGKTTYGVDFAKDIDAFYLSVDELRQELAGSESDQSVNGEAWRLLYSRLSQALMCGISVVVDSTMCVAKNRKQLIAFIRELGVEEIYGYWFDRALKECLQFNEERYLQGGRLVPQHSIRNMHEQLWNSPPSISEGFTVVDVKIRT